MNDAWFVGFTSTYRAVWVGYDNARSRRWGCGSTGQPPFRPSSRHPGDLEPLWAETPLPPPSAEAARRLKALPIDYASGQRLAANSQNGFTEYSKLDANKKVRDTQYSLAGRSSLARGEPRPGMAGSFGPGPGPNVIEERRQICAAIRGRAAAAVESSAAKLA